jgi:hypothetical protein
MTESLQATLDAVIAFPDGCQIPEVSDAVRAACGPQKHHEFFVRDSVWVHLLRLGQQGHIIVTENPDGSWRFHPLTRQVTHHLNDE